MQPPPQQKKQHHHHSNSSTARLEYLEIQLAATSALAQQEQTNKHIANVSLNGQKLFYDSRGEGSLITGDTKKLSKFKTVFSCESQFCPMFLYHLFHFLGFPFAILRWGTTFTRQLGLIPCFTASTNGVWTMDYRISNFSHIMVPYLLLFTALAHTLFNPDHPFRSYGPKGPSSFIPLDYQFWLINLFPPTMMFLFWFCRSLMIAVKYAFVSRYEFDRVVQNIETPEAKMEWHAWHLYYWVAYPERCLDNEIGLSCIRRGTSNFDSKYNFVFDMKYATVKEAVDDARRINAALGYSSEKAGETEQEEEKQGNATRQENPLNATGKAEQESEPEQKKSTGNDDYHQEKNKGLVVEAGTDSVAPVHPGAHVVIPKDYKNNTKLVRGYRGKMVDPTITVQVCGIEMIKQCVLQADKTIRAAKTQVLTPGGWPLHRWFALLVAGLQPLLFVFFPLNTMNQLLHGPSAFQQDTLSCYEHGNYLFENANHQYTNVSNASFSSSRSSYSTAAAIAEYDTLKQTTGVMFLYNLDWFICLSPSSMLIRVVLVVCAVFTAICSYYNLKVWLMWLEIGVLIYERHYRAIQFMNSLIQRSLVVTRYDEKKAGGVPSHQFRYDFSPKTLPTIRPTEAILSIDTPARALTYMHVQDLLTDVGASFLLRVQLLTGASAAALILLTLLSLAQATNMLGPFGNMPISVVVECLIIFGVVVYYVFRLITVAGNLNQQMEQNVSTILDLEKQVLLQAEEKGYGEHSGNLGKGGKGQGKGGKGGTSCGHGKSSLNEVLVSVFALEDTRQMMVEQYKIKPITFLGLKAGPTMFTTLGTLVVTAGSTLITQLMLPTTSQMVGPG